MKWLRHHALYFAWTIALSGLAMSLYFGEVLNLEPCRLCWYQRSAIIPLTLFLGIATYKNERKLAIYSWPLVLLGGLFALYQTLLQHFPEWQITALCGQHCSPGFLLFGSLSFPLLSLIGFSSIAILLYLKKNS